MALVEAVRVTSSNVASKRTAVAKEHHHSNGDRVAISGKSMLNLGGLLAVAATLQLLWLTPAAKSVARDEVEKLRIEMDANHVSRREFDLLRGEAQRRHEMIMKALGEIRKERR